MGKDRNNSNKNKKSSGTKPSKGSSHHTGNKKKGDSSITTSATQKLKQSQKEKLWKAKAKGSIPKDSGNAKPGDKSHKVTTDKASKVISKSSKSSAPKVHEKKAGAAARMELVESLKNDWNRVRVRSISTEEKTKLISKLMASIKGHVLQVTLRHDVSRIVQCVLQFGSEAQRSYIVGEMAPKLFEICKTPYGHFAVLKAITYCSATGDQKKVVSALTGHFVALGTNVIGARTVESVLHIYPGKITRALRSEFYGKNFVILQAEPPRSLRDLVVALPTRASAILDHMTDLIQKFISKGLLEFVYVHQLLWEYVQELLLSSNVKKMDLMVSLLAEAGTKLMVTKPGAKVVCALAAHASAKDRKRILKSLKGHVLESVLHASAHLAIMRIIDVTDDTVSVQKMILSDIRSLKVDLKYTAAGVLIGRPLPPIVNVAIHPQGCKLLLRLLAPHKKHLEPDEEPLFVDIPAHSKKDPAIRRKELLTFLKSSLISACTKYATVLLRDRNGSRVLQEVISVFYPAQVLSAVAKALVGEEVETDDMEVDEGEDDENEEEEEEEEVGGADEETGPATEDAGESDGEQYDEDMDEGMEEDDDDDDAEAVDDATATEVEPQLPIEEDSNANQSIRRILEVQKALDAGTIETELHDSDSATADFATELLEEVVSHELLAQWTSSSRGCFALANIIEVPSMKSKFKKIVKVKDFKAAIKAGGAEESAGGKKLLEVL